MTVSITVIYGKTKDDFRLIINGKRIFGVFDAADYNTSILRDFKIPSKQIKAFNNNQYNNHEVRPFIISYHIIRHMAADNHGFDTIGKAKMLLHNYSHVWHKNKSFSFIANI